MAIVTPVTSLGNLNITMRVKTPSRIIEQKILKSITNHLNQKLSGLDKRITQAARHMILSELQRSEVTESLISGRLRGELGVVNAGPELNRIYDAVAATVQVTVGKASKRSGGIMMRIRLTAVPFDLERIIGAAGSYQTEKGVDIPWFQWLTTLGDRVIVRDFELGLNPPRSRTGSFVMRGGGKGWRVPPHFSGTKTSNFVTRATDNILRPLGQAIQKMVKRSL